MICAPSEDSDQPWHPPSLISLRCLHEETLGPQLPIERTAKILIRLGGWFCWFCHEVAQVLMFWFIFTLDQLFIVMFFLENPQNCFALWNKWKLTGLNQTVVTSTGHTLENHKSSAESFWSALNVTDIRQKCFGFHSVKRKKFAYGDVVSASAKVKVTKLPSALVSEEHVNQIEDA